MTRGLSETQNSEQSFREDQMVDISGLAGPAASVTHSAWRSPQVATASTHGVGLARQASGQAMAGGVALAQPAGSPARNLCVVAVGRA